jgi:hypothetical protein
VKAALEMGVDPKATDALGNTALHYLASMRHDASIAAEFFSMSVELFDTLRSNSRVLSRPLRAAAKYSGRRLAEGVSGHSARVLVVMGVFIASLQAQSAPSQRRPQPLNPVSYVCPMPGDEDVLEDKPGKCPKCKMTLVPVRLETSWTCPNHPAVTSSDGGTCPIDGRDLVMVTLSMYWTCVDKPDERLMEPGKCSNGRPREEHREARAHGDHNPRHGGQFFMSQDNWHHLEGTYAIGDIFRVFTYDNFTKPIPTKPFRGRAVTREERDPTTGAYKELVSFPLRPSKNGATLEAKLPPRKFPVTVTLKMKFDERLAEQRFDFTFVDYSKEPVVAARPLVSQRTAPSAPSVASADRPPIPPSALQTGASVASVLSPMSSDCSVAAIETSQRGVAIPTATADLLTLLSMCGKTTKAAISDGQLATLYLPALLVKELALALEDHGSELAAPQRVPLADAVRRVVLAAWQLDLYGDLGNAEKIQAAYDRFAAAVTDITTAYGTTPSPK